MLIRRAKDTKSRNCHLGPLVALDPPVYIQRDDLQLAESGIETIKPKVGRRSPQHICTRLAFLVVSERQGLLLLVMTCFRPAVGDRAISSDQLRLTLASMPLFSLGSLSSVLAGTRGAVKDEGCSSDPQAQST